MLDGKEAMPENGTCPEPDKGTSPTQQESAKEEKNRNENNPPPKKNPKTGTGSVTYRISRITCEG